MYCFSLSEENFLTRFRLRTFCSSNSQLALSYTKSWVWCSEQIDSHNYACSTGVTASYLTGAWRNKTHPIYLSRETGLIKMSMTTWYYLLPIQSCPTLLWFLIFFHTVYCLFLTLTSLIFSFFPLLHLQIFSVNSYTLLFAFI